jgi:hypothetical protein
VKLKGSLEAAGLLHMEATMTPARRCFGVLLIACAAIVQSATGGARAQQQNNQPIAYTGEITDSACAAADSHAAVMSKDGIKTSKECVLQCVKDGAKFVLYIPTTKTVYNLDDQDKPQDYAGEKVTIVGTYDGPSKTIHIVSIMAAP